jgi:hypothetical protein
MTTAFDEVTKHLLEEIILEKIENTVAIRLARHYPQPATNVDIETLLAAPDPWDDEYHYEDDGGEW